MNTTEPSEAAGSGDALLAGLAREYAEAAHQLRSAVHEARYEDIIILARRLHLYTQLQHHFAAQPRPAQSGVVSFVLVESVLRRSFAACTQDGHESFHYLTGIVTDSLAIPMGVAAPDLESRGVAHAKARMQSTHALMAAARAVGLVIVGLIHSHPGKGLTASIPSQDDRRTQEYWEHTGSVISGIWTRDGYVRFYTVNQNYRIRIAGEGVEHVEGNLYRLAS